jgi:hypothetical protein
MLADAYEHRDRDEKTAPAHGYAASQPRVRVMRHVSTADRKQPSEATRTWRVHRRRRRWLVHLIDAGAHSAYACFQRLGLILVAFIMGVMSSRPFRLHVRERLLHLVAPHPIPDDRTIRQNRWRGTGPSR